MQPTFKLLLSHPAHFISLGFGSGLAPKAPGTFGSFAAWGVYALLSWRVPAAWHFEGMAVMLILASFMLGAVCIERTGKALGEVDHGAIVWDEFVAVWLVLALIPQGFGWQLAGVVVFRFFDILKPWPIYIADRRFKNGLGVMFDDLLAALYTLLCLWLVLRFW
ncbi:phosphatidylglycerophosphatase A [Uliginosibacterium sp. TH139]|uniref:phosphatidylglycerophosphatase A family protein n=1 Tax=Uliginosibacterium sp. TH139 TaxID=2067453 RepID=UPI000C7A5A83|nr:phosphatidylglycerophosphatase A [Uliginosibacterium sp. TH139]PLK50883.1 phosphatidylglycerophosphatase A [Uliginosibacterium sp. TH139]